MDEYERKHGSDIESVRIASNMRDETGRMLLPTHRTGKEFEETIKEYKNDIDSMITRTSKWKGRVFINHWLLNDTEVKTGIKAWSCNILLKSNADDTTALHELMHSYSGSYVSKKEYIEKQYAPIEEATVAYFTENYLKSIGKDYHRSYKRESDILYNINNKFRFYDSDLEFATALINVPIQNRYDWLHEKVTSAMIEQNASVKDMKDVHNYIELLRNGV